MTDIPLVKTHADIQLNPVPAFAPVSLSPVANGIPSLDGTVDEEDSSIIKCICGYSDDDGSTVFCEECNTWQHIECYYYPHKDVPDVHECVDCRPRLLDTKGATERQRHLRVLHNLGDRKVRKATGKSHKKKTKDASSTSMAAVQTNGWIGFDKHDLPNGERAGGSPHDPARPAKSPKTSHKASASLASINHPSVLAAQSRKRAGSGIAHGQSPVKSPPVPTNGYSGDLFSPEFMQLHQQSDYTPIEANSYTRLDVANSLSSWLKLDTTDFKEVTNGKSKSEVFIKPDRPIEEMPAPSITRHRELDRTVSINGVHPMMQWLTVDSFVPVNAYIGELKGRIGFKEEYISDPANRWKSLRHPEPFVFFPPHLPIYIDARNEGTEFRYVRRSCSPNLKLQNFLVKDREYHFCLISERPIDEGEELTIGWELDETARQILSNSLSNGKIKEEGIHGDDDDYISDWVTGVLANFGGCACNNTVCPFDRFDRRNGHRPANPPPLKPAKSRKPKKATPLSTGRATNSRAGSEAYNRGDDDDRVDSRSVSGSSRSKPGSRDITPMTHTSEAPGVEMSEREKRKMQQVEKMFAQAEYEEQHGGKRKKRNSAGSTLNTPSATTFKQLGFADQPNMRTTTRILANGQSSGGRMKSGSSSQPPKIVRPVYVDASTQTEGQDESMPQPAPRRPHVSFAQKLLLRAREERLRWEQRQSAKPEDRSSVDVVMEDVKTEPGNAASASESIAAPPPPAVSSESQIPDPPPTISSAKQVDSTPKVEDVEMEDAGDSLEVKAPKTDEQSKVDSTAGVAPQNPSQSSHPPIQPPPPPWPSAAAHSPPHPIPRKSPPPNLLNLPPIPTISTQTQTQTPTTPSIPTSTEIPADNAVALSPASTIASQAALLSPSVTTAVTPSPAKKKMSLSDYTNRKKKISALSGLAASSMAESSIANPAESGAALAADGTVAPTIEAPKDPPTLHTSSSVLEEVDMPLAPLRSEAQDVSPASPEPQERKPDGSRQQGIRHGES